LFDDRTKVKLEGLVFTGKQGLEGLACYADSRFKEACTTGSDLF
jgi:hypothetical protein